MININNEIHNFVFVNVISYLQLINGSEENKWVWDFEERFDEYWNNINIWIKVELRKILRCKN